MKTRPKDDFITARVGVDDSFGRGVKPSASNARARDALGVKVVAVLARSISQPRLRIQNDGEHSTVEVVRQTCDECKLSVEKFPTRRGWPESVLSTEPEERSKSDFAVHKDCAMPRSRTSHVETSIQVVIWSVVEEVSGD